LRDRLFGEIAQLTSTEESTTWALRILPAKNTLTTEDAQTVEAAFAARVATLDDRNEGGPEPTPRPAPAAVEFADTASPPLARIDKSTLTFGEPRRYRNKAHLMFVAAQPCIICGRKPTDPHHLRFAQARALGRKVSDEFAVPLCRSHHRALHRSGDEARWWSAAGIEPIKVARKLWRKTRLPGTRRKTKVSPGAVLALGGHTPAATPVVEKDGPGLGQPAGPLDP